MVPKLVTALVAVPIRTPPEPPEISAADEPGWPFVTLPPLRRTPYPAVPAMVPELTKLPAAPAIRTPSVPPEIKAAGEPGWPLLTLPAFRTTPKLKLELA